MFNNEFAAPQGNCKSAHTSIWRLGTHTRNISRGLKINCQWRLYIFSIRKFFFFSFFFQVSSIIHFGASFEKLEAKINLKNTEPTEYRTFYMSERREPISASGIKNKKSTLKSPKFPEQLIVRNRRQKKKYFKWKTKEMHFFSLFKTEKKTIKRRKDRRAVHGNSENQC